MRVGIAILPRQCAIQYFEPVVLVVECSLKMQRVVTVTANIDQFAVIRPTIFTRYNVMTLNWSLIIAAPTASAFEAFTFCHHVHRAIRLVATLLRELKAQCFQLILSPFFRLIRSIPTSTTTSAAAHARQIHANAMNDVIKVTVNKSCNAIALDASNSTGTVVRSCKIIATNATTRPMTINQDISTSPSTILSAATRML